MQIRLAGCRWEDAKLVLMRDNFFAELVYFDKSQLSPAAISRLAEYCSSPAFTPEAVSHCSVAAAHVCQWIHALCSYAQKQYKLQPLMDQLSGIEQQQKQVLIVSALLLLRMFYSSSLSSFFHLLLPLPLSDQNLCSLFSVNKFDRLDALTQSAECLSS